MTAFDNMPDPVVTFDLRTSLDKLVQPQVLSAFDRLPNGGLVKLLSNEEPRWLRSHLQVTRAGKFKWQSERDNENSVWVVLIEKTR